MTVLIAGCGYLGRSVALRLRQAGHRVLALTRSEASAEALRVEGLEAWAGDMAEAGFLASLPQWEAVVHCAASGRGGGVAEYRRVYVDGVRALMEARPGARWVFTSSSSVYAQIDGSWVTEESPAEPERETGRVLREAEDTVLAAGGAVVRLAGLYGPGRSVLLRNFLLGESQIDVRVEPPPAPDGRWINQIHRDDAASAVVHALLAPLRGVFNASDFQPMTQREVYTALARRFGRPLPPEGVPALGRKRGWTHKRVRSEKLAATGWAPRYRSWLNALDGDPELVPSILRQCQAGPS